MKKNIPISKAITRMTIKPDTPKRKVCYPLYTSYQERYDFQNIRESLDAWNSYSNKVEDNVDKMLELFNIVNEKGSLREIDTAATIITSNLLSVSECGNFIYQLKQIKNSEPIIDALEEAVICDKLVKNYSDLCNRFNVNEYIQENAYKDNFSECIYELCSFIDTYKLGIDTKFRMALDEIQFGFARNHITYPAEKIVEDVTSYFLTDIMKPNDKNREILDIMDKTIDSDPFYSDKDKSYITYCKSIRVGKDYSQPNLDQIDTKTALEMFDAVSIEENSDIAKSAIAKFKMLPKKSPGAFRVLVNNLLVVKREEDIIDDTYNILSVSFYFVIVAGAIAVSTWAGIIAFVVTFTLSQHFNWQTVNKVITVWHKHRAKVNSKYEKEKDPDKKKKLKAYLDTIDKSVSKIEMQYDKIKPTDGDSAYTKRPENYGDDGFGFDLESALNSDDESLVNKTIQEINEADDIIDMMTTLKWDKNKMSKFFSNEQFYIKSSTSNIQFIAEFATKYPEMFDSTITLAIAMEDAAWSIRYDKNPNYERIMNLSKWAHDLREANDTIGKSNDIIGDLEQLYYSTESINEYVQVVNELGLDSHVKLAIDKMIDIAKDIDVKSQVAARTIDGASRLISKAIERSMTMENREAVIRGEILPSMSKCIKLALVTGGLFLINPVVALIAVVVRFVMSKRIRSKERQLVLNELDVELTMIDKYIQQDEAKGDMKKLKEHLLLKKKLQSQYSRLRYNVKIEWNDNDVQELRGKKEED